MIRLLVLLLSVLIASPLLAAPSLDPAAHPYVALVSTDKARYAPGAEGNILISLRNPRDSSFRGTMVTTLFRNGFELAQSIDRIRLRGAETRTLSVPFTAPPSDMRGYRVDVNLQDAKAIPVDAASGSIDVQSGALPARFPRQCWISKWNEGIDAAALMDSQIAWRCNIVQAYANYYRPELAPPPDLATWLSLPNKPVSRTTIERVIAAAHARDTPILFFQGTGEAYDSFLRQNSGPGLEQGSFVRACSDARPCTEADMDRSPQAPDNWSQYGWQADHLDLFDLCSRDWQAQLLSRSIKPMLDQFGFDGWQADTLGPPGGVRYDSKGQPHDPGACLSDFTSGAQDVLGRPVVVNNVSGWHLAETAQTGRQPMIYRETWNYDSPTFASLDALTNGASGGIRRYTARAIIQPAYLQRSLAAGCARGTIVSGCAVNMASPRLATAMFAIAGSTFMNHMDDGCVATGVFIEGFHLACPPAVTDALLTYKNFEVAYQPILRDGVTPSAEPCTVTSGADAGSAGAPGRIYLLGRTKAGFQICQLLNLRGVPTDRWSDLDGTMPAPSPATDMAMKLYYAGSTVTPGTNKLWWASPDTNNGAATELAYTVGADAAGRFVAYTLPSLAYWTMVVLETNGLADSDLHLNPYEPIRGAHFNRAANGVGSAATVASAECCGRWASYAGLRFGSVSPGGVTLVYGTRMPARITLRLDSETGPVIGSCTLAATSAGAPATTRCPIAGATGLRDLFIVFDGAPIWLYNFQFVA